MEKLHQGNCPIHKYLCQPKQDLLPFQFRIQFSKVPEKMNFVIFFKKSEAQTNNSFQVIVE